jgi:site-specific recombinase XerD
LTLLEAWECYEKDKQLLNYSPYTLKGYKIQCSLLKKHFGNKTIGEFTKEQLKDYLLEQDHLKPSSIAFRVKFLRSFFRWAVDEGFINKNPAVTIGEPKMGDRVPKFLTEEDIENLRESCKNRRERAIFEFLYTTGCRIGEAVRVDISDINWQRNSLIVLGKGDVEREVYFNTKCRIWMQKYLETRDDDCPAMFTTIRRPYRRLSIDMMRIILKKVAERSGIGINVYPHKLRHSYATHLLDNGAPMEAIQQLLGHAKLSTTEIYAKLSGEHRRRIYKKYFH